MFSDVPKHKLIHDVVTRWNSTYDMIERVCEQQLPISSVLLQRQDTLMHLELLPNEWRILENILKLLRPFKIATKHLSGEKYPTISALGPLYSMKYKRKQLFKMGIAVQLKVLKKHYRKI